MEPRLLPLVCSTTFVAELGDTFQVLTLPFTANKTASLLLVFLGGSLALVLASGIGVLAVGFLSVHINQKLVARRAGGGFILLGVLTLISAIRLP